MSKKEIGYVDGCGGVYVKKKKKKKKKKVDGRPGDIYEVAIKPFLVHGGDCE